MEKPLQYTRDQFEYQFIEDKLIVKRMDSSGGWGQNLVVTIINHQTHEEKDLFIGPSESNIMNVSLGEFLHQNFNFL
jgi:hypothetical protein